MQNATPHAQSDRSWPAHHQGAFDERPLCGQPLYLGLERRQQVLVQVLRGKVADSKSEQHAGGEGRVADAPPLHHLEARCRQELGRTIQREAPKVLRNAMKGLEERRREVDEAARLHELKEPPRSLGRRPNVLEDLVAYHQVCAVERTGQSGAGRDVYVCEASRRVHLH